MFQKNFILACIINFSSTLFAQKLPLQLFWQGKTELAIKLAHEIIQKPKYYSKQELISSYDFLAEYNLEQGHYEANKNYIHLLFKIQKSTSFDSALYYVRLANYYHCYMNNDSTDYLCKKSQLIFKKSRSQDIESNSIARYYSYLGNASRNTSIRSISFLDSAKIYSRENFIKAVSHRRYATFLLDKLSRISIRKREEDKADFLNIYLICIRNLKTAEKIATTIFPNKKSDLHSRIYDLWSLAEELKGNHRLSTSLNNKARISLIDNHFIVNFFEYSVSLNLEASNKLYEYSHKKGDIKLVYEAETLLNNSIPYWESFLNEEGTFSKKQFDDRYSVNPYVKLTTVYYELYKKTKKPLYLQKIQGLSEIVKHTDNLSEKNKFLDNELNQQTIKNLQKLCHEKNHAIINYVAALNPHNLMAIVSLPDTTLLIQCANVNFLENYIYDYNFTEIFLKNKNIDQTKNMLFEAYNVCFKSIDNLLQKKRIKTVNIITHGLINGLNFDFIITDTISKNPLRESLLIKRYKIIYHTNSYMLSKSLNVPTTYSEINVLAPNYKKTSYAELIFSKKFIEHTSDLFNVKLNTNNKNQAFFKNNQLVQYLGHVKSHTFSNQQYLLMNDTDFILSDDVLKYNLNGSSYMLNGCASNIGKHEMNNRINNLPTNLMNQHAHAVMSTLWPIDDKENAEFLEKFYEFMSKGLASTDALRETKLYFINKNYSPLMWGAYMYYGNDFYLSKKHHEHVFLYLAISAFVLLLLFLFLIYKQRKQNTKTQQ